MYRNYLYHFEKGICDMKKQVKIVIGANYGDECKGFATYYFSSSHLQKGKCVNILFNGSCQRGHTVELSDGKRHVFHHFGSGSFTDAVTYFDPNFIVNPIFFLEEYRELKEMGILPISYCSPECRVAVPYDAIVNQIVEESRGKDRHGSCGLGVWETRERYNNSKYNLSILDLCKYTDQELKSYLKAIASEYVIERLHNYGISTLDSLNAELLKSDGLVEHYIQDFREMCQIISFMDYADLFASFDSFIFEGGQGLALDENNLAFYPYLTPSSTTSAIPLQRIAATDCDVEVCYITRSYFTRHGAGPFPSECDKKEINPEIVDLTNSPNKFQETLRYGKFAKDEFLHRVTSDMDTALATNPACKFSLFISHLNYTNYDLSGDCSLKELIDFLKEKYRLNTVYLSDRYYADSL